MWRKQLDAIDPSWCPSWPVEWQRAFHLVRQHLAAGRPLPTSPGDVMHQGEDLGRWVRSVRYGWDKLTGVQQWMCEHILGIEPAADAVSDQRARRIHCQPRHAGTMTTDTTGTANTAAATGRSGTARRQ
ncbi:hypothetical protein [Streptomyces sp. DSM 118148]|uniref:hypothetical protein n=1 Tax=Streptomyces sp. DSM 118148 TaxID=3448667 RepID=UPI00403FDEC9